MKRILHWTGLAAFCAVFGFLGSVAAVQVMAEDLRGKQGPRGATGAPGAQGDPAPAGELDIVRGALIELDDRLRALEGRTGTLEQTLQSDPLTPRCTPTEVVTDVSVTDLTNSGLWVDKTHICASGP